MHAVLRILFFVLLGSTVGSILVNAVASAIRFPLRALPAAALFAGALATGMVVYRRRLAQFGIDAPIVLLRFPMLFVRALCYAALGASLVYAGSFILAMLAGWALPSTALIRWSALGQWAARNEPYLGHYLLGVAVGGAIVGWMSPFLTHRLQVLRRDDLIIQRFLRRWGAFIAACLFAFGMSAIWAGLARFGDLHINSIGGLIPFSDAGNYWAAAHDGARDGVWNEITLRRPLAGAFRSVLMLFGAYSTSWVLLLQAVLVSAAVSLATWAVWRWRGIWAALTFFALSILVSRAYVPTFLTEPLGLAWAFISVPFFIEALRTRSLTSGLIALALLTVSLMTRMGSMFTIPFFVAWLAWERGATRKRKATVALAGIAVVASVMSVNLLLQRVYGSGQPLTGSNFSYTLCGLSIGGNWTACDAKYKAAGVAVPSDEAAHTQFLYARAAESIKSNPQILIGRLYEGARQFIEDLPGILLQGYMPLPLPLWLSKGALIGVMAIGLLHVLAKRRERGELLFWLLLVSSVVISAGFVFFDDGKRILIVIYPILCVLFASSLWAPTAVTSNEATPHAGLQRAGLRTLAAAAILMVLIPWLAHRLSADRAEGAPVKDGVAYVMGGRQLNGFLVVQEGSEIDPAIPTLQLPQFAKFVELSLVEQLYQGILRPQMPTLPFGFVSGARLEKGISSERLFIVPAEVLERRDVRVWRLHYVDWNRTTAYGPYWFYVTKAEPLR